MAPILILRWQEKRFSLTVALRLLTTTMDSAKSVYLTCICQSSHCNVCLIVFSFVVVVVVVVVFAVVVVCCLSARKEMGNSREVWLTYLSFYVNDYHPTSLSINVIDLSTAADNFSLENSKTKKSNSV